MDEPMELELGSMLLRCDRGMFEFYSYPRPEPDMRMPVRWLAVALSFDKRGQGAPKFGVVKSADTPLYGADASALSFTLTASERLTRDQEPALVGFLAAIAERYRRRMPLG